MNLSCWRSLEVILMSTNNIGFNGEISKITLILSPIMHLICSTMIYLLFVKHINQPAWCSNKYVTTLLNLSQLIPHRCPSIQHHRSQHRSIRKLPGVHVDLGGQFSGWGHHEGLGFLDRREGASRQTVLHHTSQCWEQESSLHIKP